MKKWFTITSILVLVTMVLSACASPTPAPTTAPAAPAATTAPAQPAAPASGALTPDKITLAGVVFQDDQFMNTLTKGYTDAAAKYGVKVLTANTNNDQAKEAELIQTYVSQGVNGIAIAPLSKDASIANLKDADGKGVKVAITNMSISDPSFLAGGFTSDDATNAKIVGDNAAKFIKDNVKGAVNVARVDFDDQLPDQSKARWSGFYDGLKAGGVDYKEVGTHLGARPGHRAGTDHRHADRPPGDQRDLRRQRRRHDRCGAGSQTGRQGGQGVCVRL